MPSRDPYWNQFYSTFSQMTQRNEKVVKSLSVRMPLNYFRQSSAALIIRNYIKT